MSALVSTSAPLAPRATVRALVELTRPRVLALVLLTAPPVLLNEQTPGTAGAATLAAICLLAAGCSAANACWEHDLDAKMARTRDRPLPSGRLPLTHATAFATLLCVAGVVALGATGGPLAALLGLATVVIYVGVYTMVLKQTSAWQMVVGALAGAAAPLLADASDGSLNRFGVAVFLLVFAWQPPHFWAISLFRQRDYEAAGIPTLPSVIGAPRTRLHILAWWLVLVPVSLLPWALGGAGATYAAVAVVAGVTVAAIAAHAIHHRSRSTDRRVFIGTIAHLTLLLIALVADRVC